MVKVAPKKRSKAGARAKGANRGKERAAKGAAVTPESEPQGQAREDKEAKPTPRPKKLQRLPSKPSKVSKLKSTKKAGPSLKLKGPSPSKLKLK